MVYKTHIVKPDYGLDGWKRVNVEDLIIEVDKFTNSLLQDHEVVELVCVQYLFTGFQETWPKAVVTYVMRS